MKSAHYPKYGPPEVVQIIEVDKPEPKANEVLIKVHATTVSSGEARVRASNFPPLFWLPGRLMLGIFKPRYVLGNEVAGVVEAVGSEVTRFQVGDAVFGGIGSKNGMGAHAEYKCVPEDTPIVKKPESLSFGEAASIPFGMFTAMCFLKHKGDIQAGQQVLINGASGAVGTASVQLAKYYGAEVTGVCSAGNTKLVKSLGADHVIDYKTEDFTQGDKQYDLIFETIGASTYKTAKAVLKPEGKYLAAVFGFGEIVAAIGNSKRVVCAVADENIEDLAFFVELLEKSAIKPVVDRHYPFAEIVEAHRHVDTGRKRGNVVVDVV